MSALMKKLRKNSTIESSSELHKQELFNNKIEVKTKIPALNIAFSGTYTGGYGAELVIWAGKSKMFKTFFCLLMAKAYLDEFPEAIILFYDSEMGCGTSYFKSVGIDPERVYHCPIMDIEEFKFDIMKQLEEIDPKTDKVFIMVDSIGNLASRKEKESALDGKSTVDMTRNRELKSLSRMITPYLRKKNIPMAVIAHTYADISNPYGGEIVSSGRGFEYSATSIFVVSKRQEKDGTDLIGYQFNITVEKSRYVREKSKIPITVRFEGGIEKWSGLLDLALESGHVIKPSNGWYSRVNKETGEIEEKKWRAKDTNSSEFWGTVLQDKTFSEWVENNYKVAHGKMLEDEELESAIEAELAEDDIDE